MRRLLPAAALLAALVPVAPAAAARAPTRFTGRLLVLLDRSAPGSARAAAATARAVAASAEAIPAGHSAPQIGLVTVRARPGESLHALALRLRSDPRVRSVQP